MKIVTLIENTSISKDYKHQHGLSLYIETEQHKILFDTGSNGAFIENAKKLGIDLGKVDTVVISHGHYDHGGGLKAFLKINTFAKIYIGVGAFDKHAKSIYKGIRKNIGLKASLLNSDRLRFVKQEMVIDEELVLFGHIFGKKLLPKGNKKLLMKDLNKKYVPDDFEHEINLLITEETKTHLICGCAHNGIGNIIDRAGDYTAESIDTVVGGFHLLGISPKVPEDQAYLDALSTELTAKKVKQYYTCHCTGAENFEYMKVKNDKIGYIKTGMVVEC